MENENERSRLWMRLFVWLALPFLAGCSGSHEELLKSLEEASDKSPVQTFFVLAFATVVSEDLACISAGVLVSQGVLPFALATLGCLTGIVMSDVGLFLIGMWWGEKVVTIWPIKLWVTTKRLALGERLYRKYGGMLVVSSRFLPGTRMMCYIAAGMLGYPWKRFACYMTLACLVWTPAIVALSMAFGILILGWFQAYTRWALVGVVLAVAFSWIVLKWIIPLFNEDGREILKLKVQRWFGRSG